MERPFSKIANLPNLVNTVREVHESILATRKNNALIQIDKIKKELSGYVKEFSKNIYEKHVEKLNDEAKYIENAIKIVAVVAEESRIKQIQNEATTELLNAKAPETDNGDQPAEPEVKAPESISKDELFETATLKTKGEVDQYLEKLKSKLYQYISKNGIDIK